MTCENCAYCDKTRTVDSNFNREEHWTCKNTYRNLKHFKDFSETFRQRNPSVPLSIVYYDNTKKDCPHHKVDMGTLDRFTSKSNGTKEPKPVKTKLPEHLSFLERD